MADDAANLFQVLNEIAIVSQLSTAVFEARLPEGVLVSHFSVLNHLTRVGDGATPLALARAFQVPKTTMTHTLSGLVARNWVDMRPNPDDGRSKRVWLTPEGRAFRNEAIDRLAPDLARISAALPGLADDVLPGLIKLRSWLDADRDAPVTGSLPR